MNDAIPVNFHRIGPRNLFHKLPNSSDICTRIFLALQPGTVINGQTQIARNKNINHYLEIVKAWNLPNRRSKANCSLCQAALLQLVEDGPASYHPLFPATIRPCHLLLPPARPSLKNSAKAFQDGNLWSKSWYDNSAVFKEGIFLTYVGRPACLSPCLPYLRDRDYEEIKIQSFFLTAEIFQCSSIHKCIGRNVS